MNHSMSPNATSLRMTVADKSWRNIFRGIAAVATLGFAVAPHLSAQVTIEDPENYKLRIAGQFWSAHPSLTLAGNANQVPIDFNKTLGFDTFSTFTAAADWHFAKKHHFLFIVSPNKTSRTAVLKQTITFRDKTFLAGSSVNSELTTYSFNPGYRYDILHKKRGHLGIVAQLNLIDIKAKISASVLTPGNATLSTASGSLFTPLPVLGPEGRMYFAKNRVYVDANLKGMYFFGYGNFISTAGSVGVVASRHINIVGGYQMGSDLAINGTTDRLSVRLTQRGPTVGMEFNF